MKAHPFVFRTSWISLLVGVALALISPYLASRVGASVPGWDNLDDALGVLVWGWATATLCFLVALGTGVRVWREHKIVLLWVLPIALYVMFLAAWGIGALVGPYWRPHWL